MLEANRKPGSWMSMMIVELPNNMLISVNQLASMAVTLQEPTIHLSASARYWKFLWLARGQSITTGHRNGWKNRKLLAHGSEHGHTSPTSQSKAMIILNLGKRWWHQLGVTHFTDTSISTRNKCCIRITIDYYSLSHHIFWVICWPWHLGHHKPFFIYHSLSISCTNNNWSIIVYRLLSVAINWWIKVATSCSIRWLWAHLLVKP